ncbi:2-amino-4-hydroxy-6-hydroxymethyldihydropteridine diphosphokinase [Caulobacter sp. KR2-114]|uniref:2-amino-4-hydroxy-6- hydroxymethyldihydropteridine diphosphokinase n=1 Tax=Caulobacter sp. KR2-114 TaxID=3400912 RepID=UPI003C05096C
MDCFADAIIVAMGSNLSGDYASSTVLLEAALSRFSGAGLVVARRSSWWRSAAWPDPSRPDYLNGVVLVETTLSPDGLMRELLAIERQFGRRRDQPNDPRTLDLDLIAYGRMHLESPGLTLPHPRAHERRFVMGPLAEIAPDWVHPTLGGTALAWAARATVGADATPVTA